ncbi:DUF481 domain-containing protein [Catenovulum sp. SM1970]|uniref:DUF481 domain-containing protein n=1 Tax=Marinifaba aquimaris TaxID=2741323 RepID=UPI0015727DFD|nr:DUF481 domain-containing protein [Marinifaba aquimaris]NTS78612.1 DUF481 domain-containing protein [Marinifaba aquimaris]
MRYFYPFLFLVSFSTLASDNKAAKDQAVEKVIDQKVCDCGEYEIIEETVEIIEIVEVEEEKEEISFPTWRASTEFGVINTQGNNNSTLGKLKSILDIETERFRNNFVFDMLYQQDEVEETVVNEDGEEVERKTSKTSKNKFSLTAQSNYKMPESDRAVFGRFSYEQDKFSSYNYESSLSFGYNRIYLKSDDSLLEFSIGPGIRNDSLEKEFEDEVTGDTYVRDEHSTVLQLFTAAKYERTLTDTSYFTQSLSIEASEVNTKTVAISSLNATVSGALVLKGSIKFDHNSEVEDGFDNLDIETGITLVYTW